MKVFITGGTGFIGRYLVERLARAGHELYCLCRRTSDVSHLVDAGAVLCQGDVRDLDSLLDGMDGCDGVVHLANVYSLWEPDRSVYYDVNVQGTRNVMDSAVQTGVSKVVHVSSIVAWDAPRDGYSWQMDAYRASLRSDYARSKFLADCVCWEYYARERLPLVVVYPASVLGAGNPKPSDTYIRNLAEHRLPFTVFEHNHVTYVHVRDVAEAIARALEEPGNIGARYPVGACTLTYQELNRLISGASGTPLPGRHLPGALARADARLTTLVAGLTGRPPFQGVSRDAIAEMAHDTCFDGSRTARELGFTYTPVEVAVREEVGALRSAA